MLVAAGRCRKTGLLATTPICFRPPPEADTAWVAETLLLIQNFQTSDAEGEVEVAPYPFPRSTGVIRRYWDR